MTKIAFLFAGQGAQAIGMGKEIANEYKAADDLFNEASDALGFDIKELIFDGDDEKLKITENTQPAILVTSIACMVPLKENGIKAYIVAGLSLGEYSAHVASESLDFPNAVKLVRKRGKFMQEAVPIGVGAMAAIMGLKDEIVYGLCKEASSTGVVETANHNCPGQIVVAGEIRAVEKVVELSKEKGAKRAMLLPVSAPFHCSLLKKAGDKLEKELENIEFNELKIPLISNVTADFVKDKSEIKDLLVRQVSSSVLWEKSVRKMIEEGIELFIEIGPGKTLSSFVKKIDRKLRVFNVEDLKSLEKVLQNV